MSKINTFVLHVDELKRLEYREREIMKLLYGIEVECAYTYEEVGRIFKITRERVRQIDGRAKAKLLKWRRKP